MADKNSLKSTVRLDSLTPYEQNLEKSGGEYQAQALFKGGVGNEDFMVIQIGTLIENKEDVYDFLAGQEGKLYQVTFTPLDES